jgi:hypothetical protein
MGKGSVMWITDGADGISAVSPILLVYTRLILHLKSNILMSCIPGD